MSPPRVRIGTQRYGSIWPTAIPCECQYLCMRALWRTPRVYAFLPYPLHYINIFCCIALYMTRSKPKCLDKMNQRLGI